MKCGNTTACCLALVPLLIMLLASLPALTATPIGKSASAFKLATPVLLELLVVVAADDELLLDTAMEELLLVVDEALFTLLAEPLTTELAILLDDDVPTMP